MVDANVDRGERVHVLLVDDPQESNSEASRLATSCPEPRRHELEVAEGIGDESEGMGVLHGCSRGDLDADDVAVVVVLIDDDGVHERVAPDRRDQQQWLEARSLLVVAGRSKRLEVVHI